MIEVNVSAAGLSAGVPLQGTEVTAKLLVAFKSLHGFQRGTTMARCWSGVSCQPNTQPACHTHLQTWSGSAIYFPKVLLIWSFAGIFKLQLATITTATCAFPLPLL